MGVILLCVGGGGMVLGVLLLAGVWLYRSLGDGTEMAQGQGKGPTLQSPMNQPSQPAIQVAKGPKADLAISAEQFTKDYSANEKSTIDRFMGKWVRVSGKIHEVELDEKSGCVFAFLTPREQKPVMMCFFEANSPAESKRNRGLRVGQVVEIQGHCTLGSPELDQCQLVSFKDQVPESKTGDLGVETSKKTDTTQKDVAAKEKWKTVEGSEEGVGFSLQIPASWKWEKEDRMATKVQSFERTIFLSVKWASKDFTVRNQSPETASKEELQGLLLQVKSNKNALIRDQRVIKGEDTCAIWLAISDKGNPPISLKTYYILRTHSYKIEIQGSCDDIRRLRKAKDFEDSQAEFLKIFQRFRVTEIHSKKVK